MEKQPVLKNAIFAPSIAGVDEAGRGPLAGPVVAAAVVLRRFHFQARIHDSKKLTHRMRLIAYDEIMEKASVGIGIVDAAEIDRINILRAALRAMERAVQALPMIPEILLVDGNQPVPIPMRQITVCSGDNKCISIMCASIIAKVTRDRLMLDYDTEYPVYGFARHKGYGTKIHMEALTAHGPTPIHRASFAPVKRCLYATSQVSHEQ